MLHILYIWPFAPSADQNRARNVGMPLSSLLSRFRPHLQAQRLRVLPWRKLRLRDYRRRSSSETTGSTPTTVKVGIDWAIFTHSLILLEVNKRASEAIKDYLAEYLRTRQYPTLFPKNLNRLRRRRQHIDRYLKPCRNGAWNGT